MLSIAVTALAFVSPRAFVGPTLVSLPRPLEAGHLRAHRAAPPPFARHRGCRLSAGTGPVPESDEGAPCPADGPGLLELARFTLPTLSALLSAEVMSVIDTAVVGASSSKELAALGPAIMLTDSSAYLFFWLNVACTNLVASALAKDDAEEAFKSVSDTLWCGACPVLTSQGEGVARSRRTDVVGFPQRVNAHDVRSLHPGQVRSAHRRRDECGALLRRAHRTLGPHA